MRPLKLRMTAFGPYKETEVVDFNELQENRLFVISGNTGAGKTTIFDGICFALYGSASGQDRENTLMLRSDFADDDTHTAVELLFELKGRYYRVLRQLGHVKKGNKSKTGDRFELYEQKDGKEIPCVDRQIVSEIDKKIEALLGLTQDQFKQIVMLPQGEFRKLLTSQTENKEEILRRLFKTETYKHISERLRIRKNKVEEEFMKEKRARDMYIQQIEATLPFREEAPLFNVLAEEFYNENQVVLGLEQEITYYENRIKQDEEKYEQAYKVHAQKQAELSHAEAINKQWTELADKESQWKEIQQNTTLYQEKEKQLQQAEQASYIYPYEKQHIALEKDYQQKQRLLQLAQEEKQAADSKLSEAKATYEKEKGRQEERDALRKKMDQLYDFLPVVEEIDEKKQWLNKQKQNGQQLAEKLKEISAKHNQYKANRDSCRNEIKALDQSPNELVNKNNQRNEMLIQYKLLEAFVETKNKKIKLQNEVKQNQTIYQKEKNTYVEMEKTWLSGQASILASHLHEGEACPVCGSDHHPNKAVVLEGAVTKKQLEDARTKLEQVEEIYRISAADWKTVKEEYEKRAADLEEIQIPINEAESAKDTIVQKGKKLKEEIKNLEIATEKIADWKAKLEKTEKFIEHVGEQKEELEKQYQELNENYKTTHAVYKERISKIPESFRVLTVLKQTIAEAEKRKEQMDRLWDDIQNQLQRAREEQTRTNTNVDHAQNQLEEVKTKLKDADREWNEALTKAGFKDTKAYEQAKMSDVKREEVKRDIEAYKEKKATLQHRINELKEVLKFKKQVDLSQLETQLQELKNAYETALQTVQQTRELYREAQLLKENILKSNELVSKREKQLRSISDLFNVVRGQNDRKISFERYLQIEYLEQIIEAANQRLRKLSNSQFQLIRSDRQESHGRQSGLALDVHDAYTGQTRDVKTLSGGEKFNASLCLALGMSDAIQSFQGNITIDTMFIDEGFGTLDEEALNKAIDTLVDLQQSGRMIGVISHVQELKSIFPAVLEVKKTKEGSSQTAFVLK